MSIQTEDIVSEASIHKICNKCLLKKDIEEFSKNRKVNDGYERFCRVCLYEKHKKYKTKLKKTDILNSIKNKNNLPGKSFRVIKSLESKVRLANRVTAKTQKTKAYLIECDCGRQRECFIYDINKITSCGDRECLFHVNKKRAENSILKETDESGFFIKKKVWNLYEASARRRRLQFNIEPRDVLDLWIKQSGLCNKTGHQLSAGGRSSSGTHTWSINRIDSNKGYTNDNIELVHKFCNKIQSKHTDEQLDTFCIARALWIKQNIPETWIRIEEMIKRDKDDSKILDNMWKEAMEPKSGSHWSKGKKLKNSIKNNI